MKFRIFCANVSICRPFCFLGLFFIFSLISNSNPKIWHHYFEKSKTKIKILTNIQTNIKKFAHFRCHGNAFLWSLSTTTNKYIYIRQFVVDKKSNPKNRNQTLSPFLSIRRQIDLHFNDRHERKKLWIPNKIEDLNKIPRKK